MQRTLDQKLRALASLPLGDGPSHDELLTLGRLCDVVRVEEGAVLQREGSTARFCWSVLQGAAALSRQDQPVAVASSGAWLLDGLATGGRDGAATTIVAMTDLDLLVFGRREMWGAVESIPTLRRALLRGA